MINFDNLETNRLILREFIERVAGEIHCFMLF